MGCIAVSNGEFCVVATPFWRDGRPPEDINTSEDEDAVFECNVNGFPRPAITWMINGQPIGACCYFIVFVFADDLTRNHSAAAYSVVCQKLKG